MKPWIWRSKLRCVARVPASLKVFLTAVAIIDDLGAIVVIALFYTSELSLPMLGAAAVGAAVLFALNRARVSSLAPYVVVGALVWLCVLKSGVHATLAGVITAFAVPMRRADGSVVWANTSVSVIPASGTQAPMLLVLAGLSASGAAMADARVAICFNYGCLAEAEVVFSEAQLGEVAVSLGRAESAVEERAILGQVMGRLYRWAGTQSPISAATVCGA